MSAASNRTDVGERAARKQPRLRPFHPLGYGCALLIVTGAMVSCGGGGDGGDTAPMASCLDFSATSAPAADTVTTRRSAGSTCELLLLELVVTEIDDVFGFSVIVGFDPSLVRYDGMSTADSLLGSDGAQLEVLEDAGPSQVNIAVSRFEVATGIDAQGSQLLLTLRLAKAGESGSAPLTYADPKLIVNGTPPQAKPGVIWSAGIVLLR